MPLRFNSFEAITKWAGSLGYKGVQVPSWDGRMIDLKKAAESKTYCDELKGIAKKNGVEITELSTHCRATSWRSIRPMTKPSMPSPRRRCTAIRKPVRNGRWSR